MPRSTTTAANAEPRLIYADSSALVKLVIHEPESASLAEHLEIDHVLATSRISLVEVPWAVELANPSIEVQEAVEVLLASCLLVAVTTPLLRAARRLSSASVRTLDAIHLASAVRIDADEVLAYDPRLLAAATEQALSTASPGNAGDSRRAG